MKSPHATLDSDRYINQVNAFKQRLADVSKDLPVKNWEPLRRWPAVDHLEQSRLDEYREISSWKP